MIMVDSFLRMSSYYIPKYKTLQLSFCAVLRYKSLVDPFEYVTLQRIVDRHHFLRRSCTHARLAPPIMARAVQTSTKSSAPKKPKDPAALSVSSTATGTNKASKSRKHRMHRGGRTMLSQCSTEVHRLFQRVVKRMKNEGLVDSNSSMSLSKKALENFCFHTKLIEQPLFDQSRKLMRSRAMSSKHLVTSMFLRWHKQLAFDASAHSSRKSWELSRLDINLERQLEKEKTSSGSNGDGNTADV